MPLCLIPAALVLSGCIGETVGCAGVIVPSANALYAGNYSGAFRDGLIPVLTFDLVLANDGTVVGTVHSVTGSDAAVTGDIRDWETCGRYWTAAALTFTLPGETSTYLSATKGKGQSEPWVFEGSYKLTEGRLVLSRQP